MKEGGAQGVLMNIEARLQWSAEEAAFGYKLDPCAFFKARLCILAALFTVYNP